MKLRPRILSLVIGILAVSFLALSVPLYWYTRSALEDELDKRLLSITGIGAQKLSKDLLLNLAKEPALPTVRSLLESELSALLVDGVEGVAIYSRDGVELAKRGLRESDHAQIAVLLQSFSLLGNNVESVVSEIYQLSGGEYFKAAATAIDVGANPPPILVVWGGAQFMTVIEQIVGSIFWIVIISVIVAVSLAIVFSRSLIRPVMQLSAYTKAIQKNIYSDTIDLGRTDEFGDLNRSLVEMHTEIRQNEQSMKQLLSGIAHEIKNPLGGIEIYTGLMEDSLSGGTSQEAVNEHRSYLAKITKELYHLKQIVLEYLDYARPARSKLEPLLIKEIFEDIHRLLQSEIRQKGVQYSLSGKGTVLGDESKLRRVFLNLLKNSLEAVDKEGVISVSIESQDSKVNIEVADNGRGISEGEIEKIFDPYYTTQDKGYGLGLAIVKNIVDEMNGTIIVKSKEGKGTKFILRLPRKAE
ncbi:MAG: HAMP domain-containing histidine kinase [Fidelibacterota bacterium]|nr:MAG: HAMP domain-containing histidine kinase [Candidatus Neomarinimicrobiota bacterium]